MTAYEVISVFIGISALLMSFGSLLIALLIFLKRETSINKKAYPVSTQDRQRP